MWVFVNNLRLVIFSRKIIINKLYNIKKIIRTNKKMTINLIFSLNWINSSTYWVYKEIFFLKNSKIFFVFLKLFYRESSFIFIFAIFARWVVHSYGSQKKKIKNNIFINCIARNQSIKFMVLAFVPERKKKRSQQLTGKFGITLNSDDRSGRSGDP